MPTVQAREGISLYYQLHGEGPKKVLLIMGLGACHLVWMPSVEYMMSKSEEYTFCIFDNRGVGYSSNPSIRFTTKAMAKDAHALLEILNWDKVHVAGISMGGMISQELGLMLHSEGRLASLSLLCTRTGNSWFSTPTSGLMLLTRSLFIKDLDKRADVVLDMLYSDKFLKRTGDLVEGESNRSVCKKSYLHVANSVPRPTLSGFLRQASAASTHQMSLAALKKIAKDVPLLAIAGTADKLIDYRCTLKLNDVLHGLDTFELVLLSGVGHGLLNEARFKVCDELLSNFSRSKL